MKDNQIKISLMFSDRKHIISVCDDNPFNSNIIKKRSNT